MNYYKQYINGKFIKSSSKDFIDVINPAKENVIGKIPSGSIEDTQKAIEAAKRAQKEWSNLAAIERARYLRSMSKKIKDNVDDLATIVAKEQGKMLSAAKNEVSFSAEYLEYIAGWARKYEGEILPSDRRNENIFIYKKPLGVIAEILPWNFPFLLIIRKAAPALLTGNTIVMKPSSKTPICAFEFIKLIEDLKLPNGVFNMISGSGSVVGSELSLNSKVSMISCTGSIEAGQKIMKNAAKNINKVSLELGGNAPAIVMDDADLELAAQSIKDSRINNTGQSCNAAERVYVHKDVANEFNKLLTQDMKNTTIGDPLKDNADMGPLISKEALENINSLVNQAVDHGAKVTTGGKRSTRLDTGFYYEPTVLVNCKQNMDIVQKEIFGPVIPVVIINNLDEAIEMANDSEYGLSSSLYTNNLDVTLRVSNELEYGETYVNRENLEALQGHHAGWKKSGIGGEDGKHGLEEYLQTRVVYMEYDKERQ